MTEARVDLIERHLRDSPQSRSEAIEALREISAKHDDLLTSLDQLRQGIDGDEDLHEFLRAIKERVAGDD